MVDAIITADVHLRDTQPKCRTDNYWEAQWRKIKYIKDLQEKYDCLVLDGGDLFNKWKSSPMLEAQAIINLPNNFITVPGNHELPGHNINLIEKSSLYVLSVGSSLQLLCSKKEIGGIQLVGFPWRSEIKDTFYAGKYDRRVAIIHTFVYENENIFPDIEGYRAIELLKKLENFDLIITGHNHMPFVVEYGGRLLVNPGSMMRSNADQIDHIPRVYLWDAKENVVTPEYIPIDKDVVTRQHIKDNTILESFVDGLNFNSFSISSRFEERVKEYMNKNNIEKDIQDIVFSSFEE